MVTRISETAVPAPANEVGLMCCSGIISGARKLRSVRQHKAPIYELGDCCLVSGMYFCFTTVSVLAPRSGLGCREAGARNYEGHLESKERFAIKKYLLIIGKKKNMQVLSHTFTYFST